jgi:hypothetical protein
VDVNGAAADFEMPPLTTAPLTISTTPPTPLANTVPPELTSVPLTTTVPLLAASTMASALIVPPLTVKVALTASISDLAAILAPIIALLLVKLSVRIMALAPEVLSIPPLIVESLRMTSALPPEATTEPADVLAIVALKR